MPIAGGTDVMVELNFDRHRPPALLDLTRVAELADWDRDDGRIRLGAGVTYTRIIDELGDRLPGLAHGLADGRVAADPQPGHGRRQPRRRLAGRRRAPGAAGADAEVELPSAAGVRRVPGRRVLHRA